MTYDMNGAWMEIFQYLKKGNMVFKMVHKLLL